MEDEIENEEDLSDESEEVEDDEDDAVSIKTDDLTTAHLEEAELRALRRRMKKSFQWQPTATCIKKELQMMGRWPPGRTIDKNARHRKKLAKIKRKRQRQMQRTIRNRAIAGRKAALARSEQKAAQKPGSQKKQEAKVQYAMPVAADEPTYCYCGDVSYGEMIACENQVCLHGDGIDLSLVRGSGTIWIAWDWMQHRKGNGIVETANPAVTALGQEESENETNRGYFDMYTSQDILEHGART